MSNINYGNWIVRYGCAQWTDQDEELTEQEARGRFAYYCSNPPAKGKWLAEYVILEDDSGRVVESCSPGGNYD